MGISVGFDLTWLHEKGSHGGVVQYTKRVMEALLQYTDVKVVAVTDDNISMWKEFYDQRNFSEIRLQSPGQFKETVLNAGVNVVHSPVQLFYHFTTAIPMIVTMHDLQHEHFPHFFSQDELKFRDTFYKGSAMVGERVIVSYEHVKDDVLQKLRVSDNKIDVCRIGIDNLTRCVAGSLNEVKKKYNIPESYLVYTANTWPHKNHAGLIRALKLVHKR